MPATWPITLPQSLLAGATIQDDESRLITQMDAGPVTMRNRYTAVPQPVNAGVIMTGAELEIFNTFFRVTLLHGALSFNWKDPVTNDTVTYRFKTKPVWQCIRSGPPEVRLWKSSFSLEILP